MRWIIPIMPWHVCRTIRSARPLCGRDSRKEFRARFGIPPKHPQLHSNREYAHTHFRCELTQTDGDCNGFGTSMRSVTESAWACSSRCCRTISGSPSDSMNPNRTGILRRLCAHKFRQADTKLNEPFRAKRTQRCSCDTFMSPNIIHCLCSSSCVCVWAHSRRVPLCIEINCVCFWGVRLKIYILI